MTEEIVSGWHYDRILTQKKGEVQTAWAEEARIKRIMREEIERFTQVERTKTWGAHGLTEEGVQRNIALHKASQKKNYTERAASAYNETRQAHPILIGPATLDSLLESEPDRVDYIQDGKFPFDRVFFEFMEPADHVLPGYNISARLCGVQLNKALVVDPTSGEKKYDCYKLGAHFNLDDGSYAEVSIPIMQKEQLLLQASVRLPRNKELLTLLRSMERRDEEYVLMKEFSSAQRDKDMPPHSPFYFGNEKPEFDFSLGEVDLQETTSYLDKFNRLAINLINFVNAQNVTLIPHTRKVKTRIMRQGGRPVLYEANAPYHVVGIDTKTVHVEEERGSSGSLPWRVYVRGHNRHYRDDQGQIKMVTWITPHVRGPEDAPWRHHRYVALADMLQRERDKLGEYVPKLIEPRGEQK